MSTVSVVMAAFNAEGYIGAALESICQQTWRDVEVILVDDGSSDGTIREAERFSSRLDLTIVRQQNAGPSAARNNGIRRARGRYCALLDADDIMLPELLQAQVASLESDPQLGMVLTDVITFDERGDIRRGHWKLADTHPDAVLERLLMENFVTTSAVMARTEAFIDAGLFPEHRRVAEDYELWLRLAAKWKVACIDRPLLRYRYTAGSLSADKRFSSRSALDVIETFWREHPDFARGNQSLRRRSMARHLTNAAGAAALQASRREALSYVMQALAQYPLDRSTWKWLAKILVQPTSHMRRSRRPAGTAQAVS